MTTVLIVCGAGASSTFLASRLRRGTVSSPPLDFVAVSEPDLGTRLPHAGAVLVGSHLSERYPAIERLAAENGVRSTLLSPVASTPDGLGAIIELLLPLLSAGSSIRPITEGTPHA